MPQSFRRNPRVRAVWAVILCTALALPAVHAQSQAVSNGLRVHEEWYRAVLGSAIGEGGIHVADLDGSGKPKVVATAGAYWYVLSHESGEYRIEWASPLFPGLVSQLLTVDLDGVPGAEIVATAGTDVYIYDGATRRLLRTIDFGTAEAIRDLHVADADGDGDLELLFCSYPGLYVHDLATGQEEFQARDLRCDGLAVGNVDSDPSPEIVLGDDDGFRARGYVLDGATRMLQATLDDGFGSIVRTGDLDGDGRDEIVTATTTSDITVYEGDLGAPAWQIPVDFELLSALEVLDVEGNGDLEIAFGDRKGAAVHVWDAQARRAAWSIEPESYGTNVTAVAAGDPDGDGVNEILWGAYGPGLFVASTDTLEMEWRSEGADVRGPFRALETGDVDGDGEPEILYASENTTTLGFAGSSLYVHDALTKALERKSPIEREGLHRLRLADVDGDPQAEVFVLDGTGDVVFVYDGVTHEEEWRWEPFAFLYTIELADLEGDGDLELVAGSGGKVYVLDAATGAEEWQSEGDGRFSFTSLRVADVDDDPNLEIVGGGGFDGNLVVYDGVTRELELETDDLELTALETIDRDGDGTAEILIGTRYGDVAVVDPATGDLVETFGDYGDTILALRAADLTGDLVPELVLAQEREVSVFDGRSPDELLWRSGRIGDAVGVSDSLRVADIDDDGKIEILANLGTAGLRVYQVEGLGVDPPPGPYLQTPELPGFLFKVRITAAGREVAGTQEADCLGETLCVSGALPGRSELFARIIGPRPNGFRWVNLVRFTPSRVEVWIEETATGKVNYYDLPALPSHDTQLAGLVDKRAFSTAAAAGPSLRRRPLGRAGVSAVPLGRPRNADHGTAGGAATFIPEAFPEFRLSVKILVDGVELPVRVEDDCLAETVCVSGALPGRSELFLRIIGPRPNGRLWVNLVRFTTSRVEVEIEQLATGESQTYVLGQVPPQSDQLPGRLDREAFSP